MKRAGIISLLVGVPLVALIVWIANNTSWVETTVPMPLTGEALINPFYAVQRFAGALGARTAWDRALTVPRADSVIVLSHWHWSLSTVRREALEHWVESGGRLVVDDTLSGDQEEFERWSGIVRKYKESDDEKDEKESAEAKPHDRCPGFQEEHDGTPSSGPDARYRMCNPDEESFLTSEKQAAWALRDASGIQAMRVRVGRGSVTVINNAPFRRRRLFDGDHGRLFVAAAQLRRDDDVHFLSEDDHPSLFALMWHYGAPVVTLTLVVIALALWRGGVRFGPLAAPRPVPRRSLAEQIRGTGQFALRHGSGTALHAACVRALDEAAQRREKRYALLPNKERATLLARLSGLNRAALAAAIHDSGARGPQELRRAIALLEAARRHMLIDRKGSSHGTR
jgi:hypothetical protein